MYRNKLGFIVKDDFYPITGKGHDGTAMEIISSHGWFTIIIIALILKIFLFLRKVQFSLVRLEFQIK